MRPGQGCKTPFAAIAVLLFALLAGIAIGCGGGEGGDSSSTATSFEDFGSEASSAQTQQMETALHGYYGARAAGEWVRACSYIAKPIRRVFARIAAASKQLKASGCSGLIAHEAKERSPSERASLAKADVETVRVQGSDGYVIYQAVGNRYAMPTKHENGHWKLAAAGGTSVP